MRKSASLEQLLQGLLAGDRRAAAQLITLVESDRRASPEVMKRIYPHTGRAAIIGLTGPGGAGKSTLTGHIIRRFRQQGKTVGAILVDPSSPFTGGAFLGDRVRLENFTLDDGVYVRSMASRGHFGGLARATNDAARIIEAMGMDVVLVETVGIGQDEIDIVQIAQTCLLVVTPAMGDDMQAMKAGVLEIADIIVLNKADMDGAEAALKNLRMLLELASSPEEAWTPRLVSTVAAAPKTYGIRGIDDLMAEIAAHRQFLQSGRNLERMKRQRVEQEINLIFQERVQDYFFNAMNGVGRKEEVLHSILAGQRDPYSVVEEILDSFIDAREQRRLKEAQPQ
ncbi:MAG: methylmalonyl Co-A mutase-associated GTPase MeaB [Anaerolineae bacterium]